MLKAFKFVCEGLACVVLLAGFGFWAVAGWWWPISGECGRMAAQLDVRRGHYRVLGYGIAPRGPDPYLREHYGIEFVAYGCVVTESEREYVAAYNAVSRAAIYHRFGRDVLADTG